MLTKWHSLTETGTVISSTDYGTRGNWHKMSWRAHYTKYCRYLVSAVSIANMATSVSAGTGTHAYA